MTAIKKYPAGTTAEQWKKYEEEKANHEAYCDSIKPKEEDYWEDDGDWFNESAYNSAMREWERKLFMDAPNEPGYYRANND